MLLSACSTVDKHRVITLMQAVSLDFSLHVCSQKGFVFHVEHIMAFIDLGEKKGPGGPSLSVAAEAQGALRTHGFQAAQGFEFPLSGLCAWLVPAKHT